MKCTKCDGNFTKIEYDNIIVMKCDECKAFYIKEAMFHEITNEPEKYAKVLDDPGYTEYKNDNQTPKTCPECGKKMAQHNFSWDTDIIIDSCDTCRSIWLDHGELNKVAEYIETHHHSLLTDIKHDVGRTLYSLKYLLYKITRIFP